MDFDHLPEEKQRIYRQIQAATSMDPLTAMVLYHRRNDVQRKQYQLIGITDTAMLRPQSLLCKR